MAKYLWHSNAPYARTGYGSQTDLVTKRLQAAGHDVAISAFWGLGGAALDWDGIRMYPADEDWGNTWLVACAHDFGDADPNKVQVITLMDVWVLQAPLLSTLNLASWVPVDHDPIPPRVKEFFERTGATPIAMSRFGELKLLEAGLQPLYVPHGIDTASFEPIDQKAARRVVGAVPEDAFVVGMVAANKGNALVRKSFPQLFEAFAKFQKRHDDAFLYLHAVKKAVAQGGLDLIALAEVMGVPAKSIAFTPEFELYKGVDPVKMPWVYNQFDVLANPSLGEGFGIPILEAQACGVPVIVNDFSSMPELVGDGWKVGGEPLYDPSQGAWFQTPNVGEIVEALEAAYEQRGGGSVKAREFALDYDADLVFKRDWVPVLEVLEQRRLARTEMPQVDLNPNRAQRRKKARERAA